ncbi:alpha/beta hydrolase [Novosphingobium sp. PASSN1]|uniref:alpha/beta hydrolase fold domain-containing protein n=1 Tax=Novosphingobium sp. PASSN1 TaxID=2015561 RepID=UPI000BCDED1A|nr:alpha/beta hydrolase [Novosphingobium sp. PASSN1]OYU33932.1 MAG: alpha/beta hydrolase [Novosphingobium sp. PASSN1]
MPSPALTAFNAEVRATRRALLSSDYDPVQMRQMLASMDAVGPGPDCRLLGYATLELRRAAGAGLLVYVPGGGFCFPGGDANRGLLDRVCGAAGARGAMLQHRLAPEHPFPAAHDDVFNALRVILAEETGPVFVLCDSSAGALVLCACARLKREGHRLPDKLVGLSVLTDLAMTGRSNVTNAEADPMFGPEAVIHKAFHYLQGANPAQPSVSPLWDEPISLPDCLFLVGSTEVMRDDTVRYAAKAESAGTRVQVSVYDEAPHVFPLLPGIPEADEALAEIAAFLRA